MEPDNRDLAGDITRYVGDFLIRKRTRSMPFRLVDTYSGLIFEQSEIALLLTLRRDYQEKLDALIQEVRGRAKEIIPESGDHAKAGDTTAQNIAKVIVEDPDAKSSKLDDLDNFISEFLAFAMFSHRWRGREPTLDDVRAASRGIYSMDNKASERVVEGGIDVKVLRLSKKENSENSNPPYRKLQEFCCVAAKCGFRWAWSDTCCINGNDYAERSESINCMFLWYSNSDLTIVYLDDVEDVTGGRLPAVNNKPDDEWYEDRELIEPLPLDNSVTTPLRPLYVLPPDTSVTTPPYLSLRDRLRDPAFPKLATMHPDSQVETHHLDPYLGKNFFPVDERNYKGEYRSPPVWLTRGWTLQEALASKRLRFYSKKWTLLEEAYDPDTDEAEERISISSFKRRARLLDHRRNNLWADALVRSTGVHGDVLTRFEAGPNDLRTKLRWVLRRATTKVEDMAYCLLGIFDVSLPALYGEGPRAFLRLQEELMKRTGDVSLFDWCGRSSTINSFLAHSPECFLEPPEPDPLEFIEDSSSSVFSMIVDFLCDLFGVTLSALQFMCEKALDWTKSIMDSPLPGHSLVNGELALPLFEYQVRQCGDPDFTSKDGVCYQLEAISLAETTLTLASGVPDLENFPTQYFLCRICDWKTQRVFSSLRDLIQYITQLPWSEVLEGVPVLSSLFPEPDMQKREEMCTKRKEVQAFFQRPFQAYLIHVEEGRRTRVSTARRVLVKYTKLDSFIPVTTRFVS